MKTRYWRKCQAWAITKYWVIILANSMMNLFTISLLYLPKSKNTFLWQAPAGHKRRIPLAVVLPRPARGAGTQIPSAQRFVWAAKQAPGKAALGALFA